MTTTTREGTATMESTNYADGTLFRFQYIKEPNGYVHTKELFLQYELAGERWAEDEYYSEDPAEIWASWEAYLDRAEMWHRSNGRPWVSITWGIQGEGTAEWAPRCGDYRPHEPNFLSFFSMPVNAETGAEIDWTRLRLVDQAWRGTNDDDPFSGFVARHSPWRPKPFQTEVSLDEIKRAIP